MDWVLGGFINRGSETDGVDDVGNFVGSDDVA